MPGFMFEFTLIPTNWSSPDLRSVAEGSLVSTLGNYFLKDIISDS